MEACRATCTRVICATKRHKLPVILILIIIAASYIEFFSYFLITRNWPQFTETSRKQQLEPSSMILENTIRKPFDLIGVNPLRVLLVADPQLLGENDHPYFGALTIWDSDRYLARNYIAAKNYYEPNIVIFLGDLTNEGINAHDAQYRRYYKRFTNIFQIPKKGDPSQIEYIYLPGDNDVGGENEPIDSTKLKWFNYTFGDYHKPTRITDEGWDLQILKLWSTDFKRVHLNRPASTSDIPKFQILASHMPLLKFTTEAVEQLIDDVNPTLIISGHNHHSTLFKYDKIMKHGINYTSDFLKPDSNEKFSKIRLDPSTYLYEIGVPTCSYRMGVKNMGFGALEIYKNGTMDYSVLWLRPRFAYLYVYLVIYLIVKLFVARFILKGLWSRISQRLCSNNRNGRKGTQYNA